MNIAFERFPEVWTWSKGVVFLGTPHRGSGIAEMATILGNIANAAFYSTGGRLFNKGVNTTLLQNLTRNSSQLNSIGSVFTKRAVALKIVTFYETFETQGAGTIVSSPFLAP
jgi:ankyrin repeat domain-containing protein 50